MDAQALFLDHGIVADRVQLQDASTRLDSMPVTGRDVPSYLATPTVITKANVALPVTDGYVTAAAVCPTAALVKLCTANGIKAP